MTQSAADLESTFARSLVLLARNWKIVVPGLALGVLGAVLGLGILAVAGPTAAIGGVSGSESAAGAPQEVASILAALAAAVVAMLLLIAEMAYVTGMAGAAWRTGSASLRDGWRAFDARGTQAFFAVVLLFFIGVAAAVLARFTFLLSGVAYAVFTIYTMAAVIIGERSAVAAVAESMRLAWENLWPTVAVVALVVGIAAGGAWAGSWLGGLAGAYSPLARGLVTALAQQVVVAYATLVVSGEYLKLRNLHDARLVK